MDLLDLSLGHRGLGDHQCRDVVEVVFLGQFQRPVHGDKSEGTLTSASALLQDVQHHVRIRFFL
jgi:hypothetical protein